MKWPRLLTAIAGTAATWGAAWSLLSAPTLWFLLRSNLPGSSPSQVLWSWVTHSWPHAFLQGTAVGATFAVVLLVGSRLFPTLRELTFRRLGLLGAVTAGGIGAVVLGPMIGLVGSLFMAGLGASTAVLSLAMARRAPDAPLAPPGALGQLPSQ